MEQLLKLLSRIFMAAGAGIMIALAAIGDGLTLGQLMVDYRQWWGTSVGLLIGGVFMLSASGK